MRTVRTVSEKDKKIVIDEAGEEDAAMKSEEISEEKTTSEEAPEAKDLSAQAAEEDTSAEASGETADPESEAGKAEAEETESADAEENGAESETEESEDAGKEEPLTRQERKALKKKDEEIEALKDRYMRTLAEYENFRRRTDKEKADLYTYAVKDVMTKILPVLDNLERGLAAIPEENRKDPVAEGMDKICKQFVRTLEDIGVKPIEAEGKEFDLNLHNAVMHVEDENAGENTVVEELQKGYTYRDSVIRHSMVKVAN